MWEWVRYFLVMVEKFTSWVEAVSCKNESAQTVVKWLEKQVNTLVWGPEEHMLR